MRFVPLDKPEPVEAEQPQFTFVPLDKPVEYKPTSDTVPVDKTEQTRISKLAAKMPQAVPETAQDIDYSMTDPEAALLQGAGTLPAPGVPVTPSAAATPTEKPEEDQAPYGSLEEALDDAVNFIQEGASEKQVKEAFEAGGIGWPEIVAHAKTRGVYLSPTITEYTPKQVAERAKKYGSLQAAPETQFAQEPTKYMTEALTNAAKRAKATYRDVATSYLTQAGVIDPMDAAFLIKENARRKSAAAPSADIQEGMANIAKAETYGDAVAEMAKNPRATFVMLVDSVAVSLPAIAPSLVLGPAGPLARMGAAFAGSGGLEYGTVLADALQDKGVDLSNAAAIESALRDPKFMEFVKEKGAKRGLAVGAFDAISMGLAGRFLKPTRTAIAEGKLSGAAAKRATMAGWGKELAVQAAGGAGGEFTAQQLTGENRPADVILEALGETVTGPLEARANLREAGELERAARKPKTPSFQQRIEPQFTMPGGAVPSLPPTVPPTAPPAAPPAAPPTTPPVAPTGISPVIPESDIEGVEAPPAAPEAPVVAPKVAPVAAAPEAPVVEQPPVSGEPAPESEEAAVARMSAEQIQDEIAKIKGQPGQSIYSALKGKVAVNDVNDVSSDKTFNLLKNKNGVPISDMVANGNLDNWLPFDMRSDSVNFDEQASTEYIKEKLRSQNYLPYETELEIQKLGEDFARADAAYSEILRIEDVNKELDAITNEERGLSAEDQAAAIAAQEGVPARTEGPSPAEGFALTQPTEAGLRAQEEAQAAQEERAIADREREVFALQPQAQEAAPPPTGDMFGATGIAQQPGKKPSYVPSGPTAIEAAAPAMNVDEAIAARLKEMKLDDLEKASKSVQENRGVSKPVADAIVRAYQKRESVRIRGQYGQATEKQIKDAFAEVDKIEKRVAGINKRQTTMAAKKSGLISAQLPDGMKVDVFKTSDGYGVGLYDKDAEKYVDGSIRRYKGEDALEKAVAYGNELASKVTKPEAKPEIKQPEGIVTEAGRKISKPFVVDFVGSGYKMLSLEDPRTYQDKSGKKFRTFEKDGVRVALSSNMVLFSDEDRPEKGVGVGIGNEDDLILEAMIVDPSQRGKGKAKSTLEDIVSIADKHGDTVYVQPAQIDESGLATPVLKKMYKSFGFEPQNSSDLVYVRKPQTKAKPEPKKEAPAPMPGAKGPQPPILKAPEGFQLKAGRNEQVALAADKLANGEITRTEYDKYVDYYMPVYTVPSPEAPVSAEGMKRVLDKNQALKVNPEIKEGTRVGLRMDLKALRRGKQIGQNGSVVSIHEGMPVESSRQGKIIGYGGAARAKNVQFAIRDQQRSFGVARNVEDKAPQQTIEGEWINDTPENIYAEAKRLMNDPAWSQVSLDPMRHSFFYDRSNMQPVISADEVLQVGRFVIAKNVKYAPREQFLYNIEVGYIEPKVINGMALDSRDARISQYALVRQKRASLLSKIEKQGGTLDIQRELNRLREAADYLKVELALTKERKDSAKDFLSKALNENVKGNIDDDVFDSIQWMYNNAPGLLNGLLLSVKRYPEKGLPGTGPAVSGEFLPVARIIRLYKGTRGVEDSSVIRHEITHTMEQMMDEGARNAVINSWKKSFQKELDTTTDPKVKKFLNATLDFLERPSQEKYQVALNSMPGYKYYQFLGPSEYWAVNAEKLMKAQMGPVWERFKKNLTKLIQYLKNLFGFDNTYVFHQVFDGIMRGDMKRFDTKALIDYVTVPGISSSFLRNVEDTDRLHAQYDVPDTPLDASATLKDKMLGAANSAKNAAKDAVNNPFGTAAQMIGALDRSVIAARNQNVWFGTGLDVADFKRYNGQLRDANGKVASSIAVTQAMHAGHVGTNVIRLGALEFNPDTQMFMAVENPMSMANVVTLKHELVQKLGKQRAANVINTYFIAKRARSIQNEYFDRSYAFENAAPNSKDKKETGVELDQVIKAYEKIPTFLRAKDADGEYLTTKITNSEGKEIEVYIPDDEAIDSFIAQENDYTQLAEMSKNWNAVNRNMLDNMYFAGILSKKRYETLIGIKDYVPWYRIMDDMTDVHEPTSGIVRGMASVPRERRFGKGGTDRDIDDVIDNMLHNVLMLTKNTMRNYAANRVAQEYATRNEQGKIKVYTKEGVDEAGVRTNILVAGRRIIVQIKDPLVAQAVIGMESFEIPSNKILAAMANLFRRTITLAPVFQVKQLFKDAPMAAWYSNTKNPFAVWGNVFSSFVSALNPNDPIVAKLKAYGIGGFQSIARSPERELKIEIGLLTNNTTDKVLSLLDRIGDASDFAQRRAIYKRVLKETGDETLALLQANNVIDFMKRGSAQHAQFLARNVAFMNAYAQSIDVLAQTLAGGGLKGKARSKAIATMAVTGGLLASMTILYAIGASMDPEYDKLDDQTKMRNIFIPFSKQMFGQPILIPIGTSASFFFKAVPEMLYNYVVTNGTETEVDKTRLKTALWESAKDSLLGPDLVPTGVKPFFEIALNRNFFTGRPLTPDNLKGTEAAEQYNASTSSLGKIISSATSIPGTAKRALTPIEADQVVRGLFGSVGALAMWGTNMMSGERPDATMKEMPVIGSFVGQPVARGREDLFYDFKERVDKKYDTFQIKLNRLKDDELSAYLEKNQDLIAFRGYTENISETLQDLNRAIRMFSEAKMEGMTGKDRRQIITELQQQKQDMLQGIERIRKDAGL